MIGRKQKKVLSVYENHLANQEAEISQLDSVITEYRNKFGDIGIKDSLASQKADLEKQLQEKRQNNQTLSLSISTKEEQLTQLQASKKQLDEGLRTLTSENQSNELKEVQKSIDVLEAKHAEIDNVIREKENQINTLLSTKK